MMKPIKAVRKPGTYIYMELFKSATRFSYSFLSAAAAFQKQDYCDTNS